MKKIFICLSLICLAYCKIEAQTYLPLTGGTLTGNLNISSGNQVQASFYGFNAGFTQPGASSNVSIFTNSNSTTVDLVGWTNGWRFIPNSSSTYPVPVVSIDQAGSITTQSGLNIFSNNFGQQIQFKDASGASTAWWMGLNNASGNYFSIGDGATNSNRVVIQKNNGYVGIGTGITTLAAQLEIKGNASSIPPLRFTNTASGNKKWQLNGVNNDFAIGESGIGNNITFKAGGNVWIGDPSALPLYATVGDIYKLNVNGNVRANQIVVNSTGADFVFEPGYKLISLNQLSQFIQANHYLPGIAPAKQMQKNGLDVGDIQTKLLQKIEELTLYMIDQSRQMEELRKKNELMQAQLDKLVRNYK